MRRRDSIRWARSGHRRQRCLIAFFTNDRSRWRFARTNARITRGDGSSFCVVTDTRREERHVFGVRRCATVLLGRAVGCGVEAVRLAYARRIHRTVLQRDSIVARQQEDERVCAVRITTIPRAFCIDVLGSISSTGHELRHRRSGVCTVCARSRCCRTSRGVHDFDVGRSSQRRGLFTLRWQSYEQQGDCEMYAHR